MRNEHVHSGLEAQKRYDKIGMGAFNIDTGSLYKMVDENKKYIINIILYIQKGLVNIFTPLMSATPNGNQSIL